LGWPLPQASNWPASPMKQAAITLRATALHGPGERSKWAWLRM
jgi:hypothetical protein